MAQAPRKGSSVIIIRAKKTIALPPCTLGFASLVEPDDYDPDKPAFKMNAHYNPPGLDALKEKIAANCYAPAALEKLEAEALAQGTIPKGKTLAGPQDVGAWLEAKLKEPKEKAKIQLPHIVILVKANRKNREGEVYQISLGCWDAHNRVLDLKALKLGMGSVVAPIVYPNVFFSKLIGFPQPSLQLAGLRVLKRVTWSGGGAPPQEDDEDIRSVMGADFDVDEDLSAFAPGASTPEPASDGGLPPPPSEVDDVKGMF